MSDTKVDITSDNAKETLAERKRELMTASKCANTTDTLRKSVKHFEEAFGGMLPCNADAIGDYITTYSGVHAVSTIETRIRMVAKWHKENGYDNPTDDKEVRVILRGLRKKYNSPPKQAKALAIENCNGLINLDRFIA